MNNVRSRPTTKPQRPFFSSGPCAKYPTWSPQSYHNAFIGRSHRCQSALDDLAETVALTRSVLQIPHDYHVAIVPGSATGAMESLFWNLLGPRPVTVLTHDVFSHRWEYDVKTTLTLTDSDIRYVPHGHIPPTNDIPDTSDVLFNWNGSTSGVRFTNPTFLDEKRQGLVICDVTSAAFTTTLPWHQLDAVGLSWQKGLGGEAAHGMIALSPKAVDRINTYTPSWPIPYIFKMRKHSDFYAPLFHEKTLNTPSLLCVYDFKQALLWAQSLATTKESALETLVARSEQNLAAVKSFVSQDHSLSFLCQAPHYQSSSTIPLVIQDPRFTALSIQDQHALLMNVSGALSQGGIGHDTKNHPSAPPSFRIWGGPTVNTSDIKALLPWLSWTLDQVLTSYRPKK